MAAQRELVGPLPLPEPVGSCDDDLAHRKPLAGKVALVAGATDGTQPDCWRYVVEVQDADLPADDSGYR